MPPQDKKRRDADGNSVGTEDLMMDIAETKMSSVSMQRAHAPTARGSMVCATPALIGWWGAQQPAVPVSACIRCAESRGAAVMAIA